MLFSIWTRVTIFIVKKLCKSRLMAKLVAWWKVKDSISRYSPDIIIATSYGSLDSVLTVGTEVCFRSAIALSQSVGGTSIAFSNSAKNGGSYSPDFEFSHKLRIMRTFSMLGLPIDMVLAKPFHGSIDEILVICDCILARKVQPRSITIITGSILSPLALKVYRNLLPKVEITIVTVPYEVEVQSNSPYFFRRGAVRWFVGNIVMRLALEFFSIRSVAMFFSDIA